MRHLKKYDNEADIQAALKNGILGKPYVVLLSGGTLDYDTMDVGPDPLTFDILTDGYINWEASMSPSDAKAIRYSLNGGEWTEIISVDGGDCRIPVVAGDTLRFLGDNERYGNSESDVANRFANNTAEFNARGNIMSLVDSENFDTLTTVSPNAFNGLFENAMTLKDASGLVLPATTLVENCYKELFSSCVSLTAVPALPATTLAESCYSNMFRDCTSLTTAPELPATTLEYYCYESMFQGCTSLTTAPELPVTTLAGGCYSNMFYGCTSLTAAPELPATTLAEDCYAGMFEGCTSLTTAPELPVTTLASNCYDSMFKDCTSLTEAPVLPAVSLAMGCYSSMFKGCTSLTAAPDLPAAKLEPGCYAYMFEGCTSLNRVRCLNTREIKSEPYAGFPYTYIWLKDASATGTFTKKAGVKWVRSYNGIPEGWTVVEE